MIRIRTSLAIVAGAALVTGCLFPSFDDMQGGQKGSIAPRSDDNATEAKEGPGASNGAGTDASTTTSSSTASNDAGIDASFEASVTATSSIACGQKTCLGTSASPLCCSHGVGSLDCTDAPGAGACETFGGHVLGCDDSADCTGGQICCWSGSSSTCRAANDCSGVELCTQTCSGGKQCTGTINHPSSGFTSKSCQ